jgi:5-methylcytosine-specific restriction endonuclease McrA
MDTIPQKVCTKCDTLRPLTDFHKRTGTKDGHAYMCRICQSAYDRDPERRAKDSATAHERYHSDPEYRERRKGYIRKTYQTNEDYRNATRERVAVWQRENKERVNAGARARYASYYGPVARARRSNPEYRARKRDAEYERLKNPIARQRLRWSLRRSKHRRRMQLEASPGHFTDQEWQDLCEQYNHRCAACKNHGPLTVDHIVPLSRGGSDLIENIQPLCHSCNSGKGTKIVDYR